MKVNPGDKAQGQAVASSGGKEQYQGAQCMVHGIWPDDKRALCTLRVKLWILCFLHNSVNSIYDNTCNSLLWLHRPG